MMAAVVLFDLAVETAAKAALGAEPLSEHPGEGYLEKPGELAKPVRGDVGFARMLDDVLAALRIDNGDESRTLPGRENIRWLHNLRNEVQHRANEPSARDVERGAVYTSDFLDALLRAFFDSSLVELSRASLVRDEVVREEIERAEGLAAKEDFNGAMERLAVAFELARMSFRSGEPYRRRLRAGSLDVKRALGELTASKGSSSGPRRSLEKVLQTVAPGVKPKPSTSDISAIVEAVFPRKSSDPRRLERLLRSLAANVERVEERLEAVAVAGDPSEYAWFRQRIPKPTPVFSGGDGDLDWQTFEPDPPADRREYLRALEFVANTALRWQQFPEPVTTEEEEDTAPDPLDVLAHEL
jgi:hypothetical protein